MTVLIKDHKFFYGYSNSTVAIKLIAHPTATWMLEKINWLIKSDFKKVNSIITDTFSLEHTVWDILDIDHPRLQNAFFILCDSH